MQLLIVHRDPEMGEALVQMMKNYTRHAYDLVPSDKAAIEWARRHKRCDLLLTQLEAEGIDGLPLGSSLSEIFPALQVLFLPSYAASERRLKVTETKVFPEPIDGDELLEAINRAEKAPPDMPDLFHVADVLQMCCLSRHNGALQLVKETESGHVFLRNGKIVHAQTTNARGHEALLEIVSWEVAEFAYERSVRPPLETITSPWDDVLIEAATAQKDENSIASRRRTA
jgi:DNA-binding response OmpR family regulator